MFKVENLYQILHDLQIHSPIWVGYSGGLDSHVLLHGMVNLRALHPNFIIRAIHINHGLSPHAHDWGAHCQKICDQLNVECLIKRVNIQQYDASASLEEAARILRYQTFAEIIQAGECVLTAHTQEDQAETLLLQLLRGAGVKGISAMPLKKEFSPGTLVRPLLGISRKSLQAYAEQNQLSWIEDESNLMRRFDRNYLRHEIFPLLKSRWSGVHKVLSRAARHCAEANELLNEVAEADLLLVKGSVTQTLSIRKLNALTHARQRNVLRFWLDSLGFRIPSEAKLIQLQRDLLHASEDAMPHITWSGVEVRRYGDNLYAFLPLLPHDPNTIMPWDLKTPLILPNGDILTVQESQDGQGFWLPEGDSVVVKFRQGGERFHPAGRLGSHPLKKLFQEWRVPPWHRERIPLIYHQQALVCVVGYGVAQQYVVRTDRRGKRMLIKSIAPNADLE